MFLGFVVIAITFLALEEIHASAGQLGRIISKPDAESNGVRVEFGIKPGM
jgi:hypothetical protein